MKMQYRMISVRKLIHHIGSMYIHRHANISGEKLLLLCSTCCRSIYMNLNVRISELSSEKIYDTFCVGGFRFTSALKVFKNIFLFCVIADG